MTSFSRSRAGFLQSPLTKSLDFSNSSQFQLIGTLKEHNGCVNRICWSDDGAFLASASDDLQVCLWELEAGRLKTSFSTTHTNSISGIRLLPNCNYRSTVTGAIDSVVEHHTLFEDLSALHSTVQLFCHRSRVKYIEIEADNPNLFFSAAEDGCVRQYDVRLPGFGCGHHSGADFNSIGSQYDSPNCLLVSPPNTKLFSMRICPTDVNLFVVASR